MAFSFNGTRILFPTTATTDILGDMTDINYGDKAAKIQVTVASDANHYYEAGIPDLDLTVDIVGDNSTAVSIGATGIVTIQWNTGKVTTIAKAVVVGREPSGGIDAPVKTSLTFARAK